AGRIFRTARPRRSPCREAARRGIRRLPRALPGTDAGEGRSSRLALGRRGEARAGRGGGIRRDRHAGELRIRDSGVLILAIANTFTSYDPRPMPASPGLAVSCRGLKKHYGDVRAVDGLDLEIRLGECFGLLGPNGAGKTT